MRPRIQRNQAATKQRREAVAQVVSNIELEMRRIDLWESTPPVPSRMASTAPFCHDTLCFHEWLQWRFLPQIRDIIDRGEKLPATSLIHPYAHDCLTPQVVHPEKLLFWIRTFDELITSLSADGEIRTTH